MQPLIEIKNVNFYYEDGFHALKNMDLTIYQGRKIACMGSNGSGKSTFFLCLNGILRPQSGTISYKGIAYKYSRKGLLNLRQNIGIVFQEPDNQIFSADIYEEISFGILNLGVSKEVAKDAVERVMEDLKITPFSQKPVHFLSGGQKKQVSIADILVMEPEVILLDEPNASLDPKNTEIINDMIDKLTKKGMTVIISTHDVDFAYQWADEVVLFHEGTLLKTGSPDEIFTDIPLLNQTHLKQPSVLEFYFSLCKKGILKHPAMVKRYPHNLDELESYFL